MNKMDKLYDEYQKLYDEYLRLFKIYDLCDERFDYDIIEKLEPQIDHIEYKMEEIYKKILRGDIE